MSEIIVEKSGKVASVVLDRPPVNALTMALYQRIAEVFEEIGSWTDVNCAVLIGARLARVLRRPRSARVPGRQGRGRSGARRDRAAHVPLGAPLRDPGDRGGERPGARRRLRARLGLRHPHRLGERHLRPAGDQCRPLRRHRAHGAPRPAGPAAPHVLHRDADQRAGGPSASASSTRWCRSTACCRPPTSSPA